MRPGHVLLGPEPRGPNALAATVTELACKGSVASVTRRSDSGALLVAELRHDGSAAARA